MVLRHQAYLSAFCCSRYLFILPLVPLVGLKLVNEHYKVYEERAHSCALALCFVAAASAELLMLQFV
eukprot:6000720-Pleurochrysis_carterae.AAC.1